jgi:hypothetical protein
MPESFPFPSVSNQSPASTAPLPTVLLNPGEVRREALPLVAALGAEHVLPAEQHGPERRLQRWARRRARVVAVVLPADVQLQDAPRPPTDGGYLGAHGPGADGAHGAAQLGHEPRAVGAAHPRPDAPGAGGGRPLPLPAAVVAEAALLALLDADLVAFPWDGHGRARRRRVAPARAALPPRAAPPCPSAWFAHTYVTVFRSLPAAHACRLRWLWRVESKDAGWSYPRRGREERAQRGEVGVDALPPLPLRLAVASARPTAPRRRCRR